MKKVKILLLLIGGLIMTTTNCLAKSNVGKDYDYIGDILYHPQSATISRNIVSTQGGILLSSDLQIDLNSGTIERTFTLDTGEGVYDGYTRYIIKGASLTVETKTPFSQSTETFNTERNLDLIEGDSFLTGLQQAGEKLNTLRKSNSTPNQANIRVISKPIKQGEMINTFDDECRFGAGMCPGDQPPQPPSTTVPVACTEAIQVLIGALDALDSCRGGILGTLLPLHCNSAEVRLLEATRNVKAECGPSPSP